MICCSCILYYKKRTAAVSKEMQPFFVIMRQIGYFEDKNYLSEGSFLCRK